MLCVDKSPSPIQAKEIPAPVLFAMQTRWPAFDLQHPHEKPAGWLVFVIPGQGKQRRKVPGLTDQPA